MLSSKRKEITGRVNAAENSPGPIYVSNGIFEGEVNMQWDAVKNANRYIVQLSKNGTGWKQVDIISDPQYTLNGLKPGTTYSFRYCALFNNSQGLWSEPVIKKIK